MATKNLKLAYDKQELKNSFNSLISNATSQISQDSKKNETQIISLQNRISQLSASKKQISLEVYKLIGNKKISEIQKEYAEAKQLKDFIELQQLKKSDLSETEFKRYSYLTKVINESGKSNQDFVQLYNEITKDQKFKIYFDSIEEAYNNIDEVEDKLYRIERIDNAIKSANQKINSLSKNQKTKKVEAIDHIKTFETFLKNNGFSTSHAEEIYNYLYNDQSLHIEKDAFKIRKRHKWRDRIVKKGAIPAAITCAGIGAAVAPLATQSLIAGSTVYGFLPVFGSMEMITAATASMGAIAGLIATPAIIKTKNELTKAHYNLKYKSAKRNLKDYQTGTKIENLHITNLINKIENTKHKILDLGQGNWFTKTFKFVPKHILNTINRNRIHHVEKYTKDLMSIYANDVKSQTEIYDLLQLVDNFVAKDIEESKLHAMLTCKESKKKHSHKSTIENIDIFANLKIYLDTVDKSHEKKVVKTEEKQAKKTINNIRQKTDVANQILNGARLFPKMIQHNEINKPTPQVKEVVLPETIIVPSDEILPSEFIFEEEPIIISDEIKPEDITPVDNKFIPVDRKVIDQIYDGDKDILTLTLENGKNVEIKNAKDLDLNTISTAKTVKAEKNKYIITCDNGVILEVAKIKKVKKEVVASLELISDLLKHNEYIEEIKNQGFNTSTIKALKNKLSTWEADKTSGFSTSGKVKELYNYCLDTFGDLVDPEAYNI